MRFVVEQYPRLFPLRAKKTKTVGFEMFSQNPEAHQRERQKELVDLLTSEKDDEVELENLLGELERMTKVYGAQEASS